MFVTEYWGMNFLRFGETVSQYFQRTLRTIDELRREYIYVDLATKLRRSQETRGSKIILRYHSLHHYGKK